MNEQPVKKENKIVKFFEKGFWAMLGALLLAAFGVTLVVTIAKWAWGTDLVKGWRKDITTWFSGLREQIAVLKIKIK